MAQKEIGVVRLHCLNITIPFALSLHTLIVLIYRDENGPLNDVPYKENPIENETKDWAMRRKADIDLQQGRSTCDEG